MSPSELLTAIDRLIEQALANEHAHEELLARIDPAWSESARNLLHYLALRGVDLRDLQLALSQAGLSSLGRSEGSVLATLAQVRARLAATVREEGGTPAPMRELSPIGWSRAEALLHEHSRELFGPKPAGRHVYVMATAPSAKEADGAWMDGMLAAGVDMLRINTAHEGPAEWSRILLALRGACERAGRSCRVLVDLPGPKLRTGKSELGPRVLALKPKRDVFGRCTAPFRITIAPKSWMGEPAVASGPTLFVDDDWISRMRPGDVIEVEDAREKSPPRTKGKGGDAPALPKKKRAVLVKAVEQDHALGEGERSIYLVERAPLRLRRGRKTIGKGRSGGVPAPRARIEVAAGEPLVLRADDAPSTPAARGPNGEVLRPAVVSCALPEALVHVKPGDRVLIDDGKIDSVVESVALPEVFLRVQRAGNGIARIGEEKGINLPDTEIDLPTPSPDDRPGLAFAIAHADMVGLSFLRGADDVSPYLAALAESGKHMGVVLKIETRQGFESLPSILLRAMQIYPVGVMIARGDLAVECGFERLAEAQEEILWIAEAAHVPAIWATQVLDGLAQTGIPSRAEVTDASMSVRAECVMLNKGPFIARAVRVLHDILRRMERHTYKKRQLFRRLALSTHTREERQGRSRDLN